MHKATKRNKDFNGRKTENVRAIFIIFRGPGRINPEDDSFISGNPDYDVTEFILPESTPDIPPPPPPGPPPDSVKKIGMKNKSGSKSPSKKDTRNAKQEILESEEEESTFFSELSLYYADTLRNSLPRGVPLPFDVASGSSRRMNFPPITPRVSMDKISRNTSGLSRILSGNDARIRRRKTLKMIKNQTILLHTVHLIAHKRNLNPRF